MVNTEKRRKRNRKNKHIKNGSASVGRSDQSRSPSRKSRSPSRKSRSPSRKSRSPSRRSRSPSRRSRSPSRKSRAPSRRSRSPTRRSRAPSRKQIIKRKSPSPVKRKSPSPVKRKSPSPVKSETETYVKQFYINRRNISNPDSLFRIKIERDNLFKRAISRYNELVKGYLFISGPTSFTVHHLNDGRIFYIAGDVSYGQPSTQPFFDKIYDKFASIVSGIKIKSFIDLTSLYQTVFSNKVLHPFGFRDFVFETYVRPTDQMPKSYAKKWVQNVTHIVPYSSIDSTFNKCFTTDYTKTTPHCREDYPSTRFHRVNVNRILGGNQFEDIKSFVNLHISIPSASLINTLEDMVHRIKNHKNSDKEENKNKWNEFVKTKLNVELMMLQLTSIYTFSTEDLRRLMKANLICDRSYEACVSSITDKDPDTRSLITTTFRNSDLKDLEKYKESMQYHRNIQYEFDDMNVFTSSEVIDTIEKYADAQFSKYNKAIDSVISLEDGTKMTIREFVIKMNKDPIAFMSSNTLKIHHSSLPTIISSLKQIFDSTVSLENIYLINAFTLARIFRHQVVENSFEVWICADEENARRYRQFIEKYRGAKLLQGATPSTIKEKSKGVVIRNIKD